VRNTGCRLSAQDWVSLDRYAVSRHLPRREIGHLQDVVAAPWAALGIRRGIRREERVERGDLSAATVHRSVRELHDQLPAELDARRAELREIRERIAEAQARFDKQLADEKRLQQYKRGLEALADARAEMQKVVGKLREWEQGLKEHEKELSAREERIAARERALGDDDSPSAG